MIKLHVKIVNMSLYLSVMWQHIVCLCMRCLQCFQHDSVFNHASSEGPGTVTQVQVKKPNDQPIRHNRKIITDETAY